MKQFNVKPFLCIVAFMLLSTQVGAFWRMLCHGQLGVARVDPLADFGLIADHAHAAHGASNFGISATGDDLGQSNCTSCSVTQDRSAYWTPAFYFEDSNGTYTLVPQKGGMTVYYFNGNGDAGERIAAFPRGFQMIAGDARRRNISELMPDSKMSFWQGDDITQFGLAQKALGFLCLHYNAPNGEQNEGALDYHYMRNKTFYDNNCPDGMRLELEFPSCWNGKDLTSENHKNHIQYPELRKTGQCPHGFKTRTPVLFYETIYDTYAFRNLSGRFVLSNGDPTGFGYHGDFISGWDEDVLQAAVDTCNSEDGKQEDCRVFTIQDDANATSCKLQLPEDLKEEEVLGPLEHLPGRVPIQSGPAYASKLPGQPLKNGGGTSAASPTVQSIPTPTPCNTVLSLTEPSMPTTTMPPFLNSTFADVSMVTSTLTNPKGTSVVYVEQDVTVTATVYTTLTSGSKRHHHRHHHGRY